MEGMTSEEAGTAEYSKMEELTRWEHNGNTFVLFIIPKPYCENSSRGVSSGHDQGRKKKAVKKSAKKKKKVKGATKKKAIELSKQTDDAGLSHRQRVSM